MDTLRLRAIDYTILVLLGLLVLVNGIYLAGPWYLVINPDGTPSPLYVLLNTNVYIVGWIHVVFGTGLLFGLTWNWAGRFLDWFILGAFLIRLYSLIGVLSGATFLPPSYLSHAATVIALGAYWLYVRYRAQH